MNLDRRQILAGAIMPFVTVSAARAQSGDPAVIAAWMDAWMSEQRVTVGNLNVGRFVEPIYYLLKPTTWLPDKGQEQYRAVNVPVGFVTDFASVPRIFWSLLRPDGNYTHPAIVHDYLYWTQTTPREDADHILRIMMDDFSVDATSAGAIYAAVRTFGGMAWDSNAKLKESGERRILKKLPEDPLTKWEDWKKHPEYFQ
jgi:hypothetical protein